MITSALTRLQQEAVEAKDKEAKAAGIDQGMNLWRESLPDARIPDDEVRQAYISAAEAETLASSGALSVLSGDTEDGPGTTPPTPGPDDEETRPDAAGEVSQSGDGPETPENLWQPPPESEEDGYAAPTTEAMIQSPEWIENARKVYELSGDKIKPRGAAAPPGMRTQHTATEPTDEEIAVWAKDRISLFNWNTVATLAEAKKIAGSGNPELAVAFLNLINMYDHSDGEAGEFSAAVAAVLTDPTTYAGAGVGSVASRGMAKAVAKSGLKNLATKMATVAGTAGATEGSMLAGGFDLVKQNIEIEAGAKESVDKGQVALSALIGGGAGLVLGGGGGYLAGRYAGKMAAAVDDEVVRMTTGTPFDESADNIDLPDVPKAESAEFAERLAEIDEIRDGDIMIKAPGQKGSTVTDETGDKFELIGRTKNGWYRIENKEGDVKNVRRKQFELVENPPPSKSSARNLSIFSEDAARIIKMADDITASNRPAAKATISHRETAKMAEELQEMGIDITEKDLQSHWDAPSLKFLRDTYDAQARSLVMLAKRMNKHLRNNGKLRDIDLAFFNQAHAKFVATRDLFHGVSSSAARTLNILQSKPREGVYDFAQSVIDSIGVQGGRANTERAVRAFAEAGGKKGKNGTAAATDVSERLWGHTVASAILNVRYNFMLSSWRTHFKNIVGNTISGVYEHLAVSPVRMAVNNAMHAASYVKSAIKGTPPMDPAERLTLKSWGAELRGHMTATRDSLLLAKEIAMGRDIGEGKVWNELGLRYDVVNVPNTAFGKAGTTPVRMLEAGDAFFKNQYFNSKLYSLAERKARIDEVHNGLDFETQFQKYVDNPDPSMEKEARDFAAKLTYTNDPSVYGTILGNLARGMQSLQSNSIAFNLLMPFVRTPANLLGYSIDMMGLGHLPLMGKSREILLRGSAQERQDLMARITVAVGLWAYVHDQYAAGNITGAGPQNWEEKKAWEGAGWQESSFRIGDKLIDYKSLQPFGGALNIIASAHDYMALADWEDDGMAVAGTGLLYLADVIKDDSYLSTLTDFIVAIESKAGGRSSSIVASAVNSVLVPNIMRDLRKPADAAKRSMASDSIGDQIIKQWQNAMPGFSDNLPPDRDWKGDVKHYYGNAYQRGLIPLNTKDASKIDEASAALAYSRIPVPTPDRSLSLPGMNSLDLMAMDDGKGFVYNKYVEIIGKSRHEAVTEAMGRSQWRKLAENDDIGPGSDGDIYLRRALSIGGQAGRARFLEFLMENDEIVRENGERIPIAHNFNKQQYKDYAKAVRDGRTQADRQAFPQYEMREKKDGPEFFGPN